MIFNYNSILSGYLKRKPPLWAERPTPSRLKRDRPLPPSFYKRWG